MRWNLIEPSRFKDGINKKRLIILSPLMTPPVAALLLSLMDLKRFRKINNIKDYSTFRESVYLKPSETIPMFNHSQANEIFDWLNLSDNPKQWSSKFNDPESMLVIRSNIRKVKAKGRKKVGGGILTDTEPRLPNLVNAVIGPDSFGSNPLFYEFSDVAESLFFWVRELEQSNVMPEIGIAIEALNMQAPMTVEAISGAVSDLLSPIPIPFGAVMTGIIGQIAALPFVVGVSYLNLSREDYFEAARIGVMFLPIIGPFISSSVKTGTHVYEKVMDKWNEIIDIPNRIMIVPNKIIESITKITDRLSGMGLGASMDLTQTSSLLNNFGEGFKQAIPSDLMNISSLSDLKNAATTRLQNTLEESGMGEIANTASNVLNIKNQVSEAASSLTPEAIQTRALGKLQSMSPIKLPNVSSMSELKSKLNKESLKEAATKAASSKLEEASSKAKSIASSVILGQSRRKKGKGKTKRLGKNYKRKYNGIR